MHNTCIPCLTVLQYNNTKLYGLLITYYIIQKCDAKYNTAKNYTLNFCKHVNLYFHLVNQVQKQLTQEIKKNKTIILKVKIKAEVIQSELNKKHLDIYLKGQVKTKHSQRLELFF